MKKGDIILVPFPFSDLTGNKNRPALVLIESTLDVTVAFISTQMHWKEETDILLQTSKENGLKKESLIRLSKLATIDKQRTEFDRFEQIIEIDAARIRAEDNQQRVRDDERDGEQQHELRMVGAGDERLDDSCLQLITEKEKQRSHWHDRKKRVEL